MRKIVMVCFAMLLLPVSADAKPFVPKSSRQEPVAVQSATPVPVVVEDTILPFDEVPFSKETDLFPEGAVFVVPVYTPKLIEKAIARGTVYESKESAVAAFRSAYWDQLNCSSYDGRTRPWYIPEQTYNNNCNCWCPVEYQPSQGWCYQLDNSWQNYQPCQDTNWMYWLTWDNGYYSYSNTPSYTSSYYFPNYYQRYSPSYNMLTGYSPGGYSPSYSMSSPGGYYGGYSPGYGMSSLGSYCGGYSPSYGMSSPGYGGYNSPGSSYFYWDVWWQY